MLFFVPIHSNSPSKQGYIDWEHQEHLCRAQNMVPGAYVGWSSNDWDDHSDQPWNPPGSGASDGAEDQWGLMGNPSGQVIDGKMEDCHWMIGHFIETWIHNVNWLWITMHIVDPLNALLCLWFSKARHWKIHPHESPKFYPQPFLKNPLPHAYSHIFCLFPITKLGRTQVLHPNPLYSFGEPWQGISDAARWHSIPSPLQPGPSRKPSCRSVRCARKHLVLYQFYHNSSFFLVSICWWSCVLFQWFFTGFLWKVCELSTQNA